MTTRAAAILKRIEVGWRNVWIRALTRLMRRRQPVHPPDWGARPHRVLFLRHDRIGDMILSTGLLRAIATSHSTVTLDVLASPANAPVLHADPHVGTVVVFDRAKPSRYLAALRRLRRARYDAVIDCMPTAPSLTTLLLMWASGATHRIGVAGRGNDAALTIPVAPYRDAVHVVDQLAALAAAFGVDRQGARFHPRLYVDDAERTRARALWERRTGHPTGRRLLVNISAGRTFRRWPDERFVGVVAHALATDPRLEVIVISAPDDGERAQGIAAAASVRFEPTATLRDALALVATADLVFTPDTGLAHAASAFQRPIVVMHIRGTAEQWGPYDSPGIVLSSPDGSLAALTLEPVLTALDRLLAETVPVRPRTVADGEIGHLVR